jgi:hypothetical protein
MTRAEDALARVVGVGLGADPHVEKRMEDRDFSELDLRSMLEGARGYRADVMEDRWVIETSLSSRRWEVVVEPDEDVRLLVVVTAYSVEE